jgi:hypothetical protein
MLPLLVSVLQLNFLGRVVVLVYLLFLTLVVLLCCTIGGQNRFLFNLF